VPKEKPELSEAMRKKMGGKTFVKNPILGTKFTIAISSAKGGVGKSTFATNIALALKKTGCKVGLLDADIYGPSIPKMFDINEKPQSDGKSLSPITKYDIQCMSIGFLADQQTPMMWRGPMVTSAIKTFTQKVLWKDLDFIIVDMPPGTGDIHLSLVQSIPLTGAIVVSTPQPIALADARKGVNMFLMESINVPVLGIIENMAYFTPEDMPNKKYYIFGKEGAKELAEQMNIELLAEIPIVQSVREAADAGRPAILQIDSPIAKSFLTLAKNVVAMIDKRNTKIKPTQAVKTTHSRGCSN